MKRQALAFITLALLFLGFVAVFIATGRAATTVKNRKNSIGIDEVYTNPNRYLFATVIAGSIIRGKSDADLYTVVRVQPYNTMSLYDETVMFCGNMAEEFRGKRGPLVITYETRSHKMFQGIACHELYSVFMVPKPEEK